MIAHGLRPGSPARSGEPAPDTVTALWKDDHLPRLDLAALDGAETTNLVARVLGGPVESASAHRLWTLTQGSPLFLRHLLAGEVSAGRFTAASGIWRWTSEPAISPELAGLLEREIGGLAAGVQEVVDLVALAEPVAVQTLSALTSPADLEQAESRGLVRIDGLVARLAHPLYGEVRRAAMGRLRAPPTRSGRADPGRGAGSDPPGSADARLRSAPGPRAVPAGRRGRDSDVRPSAGRAAGPRGGRHR
jgi:hypothetical protein